MSNAVVVIGAGAAGLTAGIDLAKAGCAVTILEARDRIGGRMFTKVDRGTNFPVELGPEFVHGKPPEIWDLIRAHHLETTELVGDEWCHRNGKLCTCDFFAEIDEVFKNMDGSGPDRSFSEFLKECCPKVGDEARQWALGYVQGFHAANPDLVSVHSLVRSNEAEAKIEGERGFHIAGGYAALLRVFEHELRELGVALHLNTAVSRVSWRHGHVELITNQSPFSAAKILVTLPLGVLQAKSVEFSPQLPANKIAAMEKLAMGHVIRVTLCFRQRFWEDVRPPGQAKSLAHLSFLLSRDEWFPTWWTPMPDESPVITGWAPFPSADRLSGKGEAFIVDKCLEALGRLLNIDQARISAELNAAYTYDWQSDPWSRGAYSYVKVGGDTAERDLAAPLEATLFFAGEATDATGNNGTVNGAIASGKRAAKEMLGS